MPHHALVDLRHRVPAALPTVRALVSARISSTQGQPMPLGTVPHGSLVLSLQLTRPLGSEERHGHSWVGHAVTGLRLTAVCYFAEPDTMTVVALLSPLGAYRLLGLRAADVVDRRMPLHELLPSGAWSALAERLHREWSNDPLFVLERWLRARADDERRVPYDARRAFRALELVRRGNQAGVAALASELGVSRRQLERDCSAWLGVTPRQLLSAARMQNVLRLLQSGVPLARAAALAGFADQAHMTRVLRATTGRSPRSWSLAAPTAIGLAYKSATGGELVAI